MVELPRRMVVPQQRPQRGITLLENVVAVSPARNQVKLLPGMTRFFVIAPSSPCHYCCQPATMAPRPSYSNCTKTRQPPWVPNTLWCLTHTAFTPFGLDGYVLYTITCAATPHVHGLHAITRVAAHRVHGLRASSHIATMLARLFV